MQLRPYQLQAEADVRQAFAEGARSVVYVLPTGGGKTVTFTSIANQAAAKGNRVLILVHRRELLNQASRSLTAMGLRHGVIQSGRSMNLAAQVQVASVQTIARRLQQLPADMFQLIVVDECHHSNAGQWKQVLQHFASARVLGVTATPCRGDGQGLGQHYQRMVLGPSPAWLVEQGYLAPARVFAPPIGFDASSVGKVRGDYDMKAASKALSGRVQMGDAIGHYLRVLSGKTAIAFCCSVAHAEAVAEAFCAAGVPAASIDGKMDGATRDQLLGDLATGELKVLTSCSLIGEGVDVPSVTGCILLRPTMSESLHLQMIGRCLRPQPGKVAVVLDHVGNLALLGHHLEKRDWTLEGRKKRKRDPSLALKVCPSCSATLVTSVMVCGECGHEFPKPKPAKLQRLDGELQELGVDELRRVRRTARSQARTYDDLVAVGMEQGMKNPHGWAKHMLAARARKHGVAA